MLGWINDIPNDGLLAYRFFGEVRLLPTSAEAHKAVLSDHVYDWQKPERVISFLMRVLGLGLILAEGSLHKHQRRHLLPAFSVRIIRELYPTFWRKGQQMVDAIQREHGNGISNHLTPLEFNDWTTRVTLDIIGIAGFGRDFNSVNAEKDELVENYEELLKPDVSNVIYFGASTVLPPRFINAILPHKDRKLSNITRTITAYALDLIRDRREQLKVDASAIRPDILTQVVKANVFSDQEIVDQILTMLAAGHETTSSALTWVAYLLAINQPMQDRLREEIRATIPTLVSDVDHTIIESMPYLNAVCKETIRLYPTVPITVRESIRDTFIGSQPVTKGTTLLLCPWAINRSKQHWGDDAEAFNPERWMAKGTANTGGASTNYAVITFLHGTRSCVGRDFAEAEIKCLVASFFGRYRVRLNMPESDVFPAGVITTKPKNGMHLKLETVEGW
jgi:cytochrome P450